MGPFATLRRLPRMREDKEVALAGSAAKGVIRERQEKVLAKLSTATTLAQRLVRRAPPLPLAFAGVANQDLAREVGRGRHQVGVWRRRWRDAFDNLIRIECPEDPPARRQAIEDLRGGQPRPGCPGKFTAEQRAPLIALACQPPEKAGRPITHRTGPERADEAIARGIGDSLSPSPVNR